jgi:hypothetical protein
MIWERVRDLVSMVEGKIDFKMKSEGRTKELMTEERFQI